MSEADLVGLGQDDDAELRELRREDARDGGAAERGHVLVEQRDVRLQETQQTERDVAVVDDTDDVDVRLGGEKSVERVARLGAVVTEDDADPPVRRDRRGACSHRRVLYRATRRAHSPTFVGYNNR